MKTVIGLFDYIDDAQIAISALEKAGVARHDISLMADHSRKHENQFATGSASAAEDMTDVIAVDATAGAAIGGATGLLMALTGLVIPGFGTIVAAGWLVTTPAGAAVGAAAGGLIGGLTGAGIPLEDAIYYKEGIRQGATLLAVRTQDTQAVEIAHLLEQKGAINIDERAEQYRQYALLAPSDSSVLQQPVLTSESPQAAGNDSPPPVSPPGVSQPVPIGNTARVYPHVPPAPANYEDTATT